jgi:hypothetical protein
VPRSLASRVGVQKVRWQSVVSTTRGLHPADLYKRYVARKPNAFLQLTNGIAANTRSEPAFHRSTRARQDVRDSGGPGFNVRGMGSTVVVAQNFVPGTTAADIQAVFAPNRSQGLSSCRIVTANPTVIAELVFESQEEAEVVVTKFNNKMVCAT